MNSGIPLFYWSSSSDQTNSDKYILYSSFFQAISSFAKEMAGDEIKYVIFENKGYAIQNIVDYGLRLIFGEFKSDIDLKQVERLIHKTNGFIRGFMDGNYPEGIDNLLLEQKENFNKAFREYVLKENVIPHQDEASIVSVKEETERFQNFIFKSLGYEPGKCNIGPVERQKRLLIGFGFGALAFIILLGLIVLENEIAEFALIIRYLRAIIFIPLFISFLGIYQYFFKFCVSNGMMKKYTMK